MLSVPFHARGTVGCTLPSHERIRPRFMLGFVRESRALSGQIQSTFAVVFKGLLALFSRVLPALLMVAAALLASSQAVVGQAARHSVVIFVADGLRSRVVNDATAPNLSVLARQGVSLVNVHSLFPTFTMANALGDRDRPLLG